MLCSAVYPSLLDLLLLLLSRPLHGVRPRVLDLGTQIPDLGLYVESRTSDSRPWTVGVESRTSDSRPWTAGVEFWIEEEREGGKVGGMKGGRAERGLK